MVDKFSTLPLYTQVERYLLDYIEQNNLQPGDLVPSENEISAELSISRMTIRQAVNNLVLKGILTRQRGKGTFVNDRNPEKSGSKNRGQVFLCAQLLSFTKIKRRYFQNVKPDPNPL